MGSGARRALGGHNKKAKSQKTVVTERLAAMVTRVEENEARVSSWLAAASQDIVNLRSMLAACVEAMEAHDLTISAMRGVISELIPDGDTKIEAARAHLVQLKDKTLKKNMETADEWNRQLQAMIAEGMAPELVREIFMQSKKTMTAPEIVRMQVAQGATAEVPAEAYEFSIS